MPKSTNKQEILNRLYADAVVHWNIDSIESLDPVVKTLIQGLASDIFYINNELENMKDCIHKKPVTYTTLKMPTN